ncbi:hypothetical protein GCM10009850_080020 [Nonomuraea monospora]|uniref:WYL domain-containing protein n=1 Tax=Nonomuraea monospora TaxID=568818 RepID=A0ABN3CT76_9ACTN
MSPSLLDDEEGVAVTVGLRTAPGGAIAGIEESSSRERLPFGYHVGAATVRGVEPYRLVIWGRRWHLLASRPDRPPLHPTGPARRRRRLRVGPGVRPTSPPPTRWPPQPVPPQG